ncbi:MAG: ABC transporter permease [Vicinamibacteria bacterium]
MENLIQDLRHGARLLARRPGFTAVAVASLALGVGLNTTLFSVVNAVLLRGTAVAEPGRLVEIYSSQLEDFPYLTTSYPDYVSLREGTTAFSGLMAHTFVRGILSTGGEPAVATGESVTSNYFEVLGLQPALGRGFRADENVAEGQHPVVVLSHGLWQRRFGGRPDILGQPLELSGLRYTVVGVGPPGFAGIVPGMEAQFWVPVMMVERLTFQGIQSQEDRDPGTTRIDKRGHRWLFVKGRLAEGRTVEEARAQVDTVVARLRSEFPVTNEKLKAAVLPGAGVRFHPLLDGYVRAASGVLLAAVALVLAIACANVANMLLARGASRRRELAVRAAMGAGRARLVRQLLGESLLLAALGGTLGVLLAAWAGRLLTHARTDWLPIPVQFDFHLDGTVLAFAAGISIATTLLFGLVPALSASRLDLVPALKADATGEGSVRRRVTLRDALVVTQLALSLVLLVAGSLLARGFLAARHTDLGYDPAPVSYLSFNLQMNGYDLHRATALRKRLLADLRALPGVTGAALVTRLPLSADINMEGVRVRGRHQAQDDPDLVDAVSVGDGYFAVVGVPIVQGRALSEDDVEAGRKVLVVNETMARKYWPGRSPLGERVYMQGFEAEPHEVVGVARDHKVRSVGEEPRPYLHDPVEPSRGLGVAVRTSLPARQALPMLRAAVRALEPSVVFTEDVPADEVAATTTAPTRIGALLLGAFGALALVLAAVGLYGVIAYSVSMRTRELGVRLALGARPRDVLRLVLGQGARLAAVGIGAGALLSALVGRVLGSLLYGVSALDPVAYAAAAAILFAVAGVATLVPALTAARVDPLRALRAD